MQKEISQEMLSSGVEEETWSSSNSNSIKNIMSYLFSIAGTRKLEREGRKFLSNNEAELNMVYETGSNDDSSMRKKWRRGNGNAGKCQKRKMGNKRGRQI